MLEEDAFPSWQCRAVGTTTLCMIRPQASPTPYFFSPETVFGVENSLEIDQTTDCRRLHSWSFTIDVIDIFLKSAIQFLQNHCQPKQMSSLNPGAIDDNDGNDHQMGIKWG